LKEKSFKLRITIKIEPATIAQLEILDELDASDEEDAPILHDYPLHREILAEGDYYIWPEHEEDLFYPIYTVITVDYQLDPSIPYQILEELYYPEEDEFDVETVSLVFAGWDEDIIAQFQQEITVEDLPDLIVMWYEHQQNGGGEGEINSGSGESGNITIGSGNQYMTSFSWLNSIFGRRYRPVGRVLIQNTNTNAPEPLMHAKIMTGRGFWWRSTYTDNMGNFQAAKKYRGKVRIRSKWRSGELTVRKTWNEILGFWVSDHLMTITKSQSYRIKVIDYMEPHDGILGVDLRGGHLWCKGTVHNGVVRYNAYSLFIGGIPHSHTVQGANVWAWSRNGASVCAMLKKYPVLPWISAYSNVGQSDVWAELTSGGISTTFHILPPHLRPDMIFQGLRDKRTVGNTGPSSTHRINQTVFHESAHFSHALLAGMFYWARHVAPTISNSILQGDPYLDGVSPSNLAGERIALVEGWATFAEMRISQAWFQEAYIQGAPFTTGQVDTLMEDFDMFTRPADEDDTSDIQHWFLYGLMWDLVDNSNENINSVPPFNQESLLLRGSDQLPLGAIIDNTNINLPGGNNEFVPIFFLLQNNIESACDLYNSLVALYPQQQVQLTALFNSYGY
jgi:hypothetical protein